MTAHDKMMALESWMRGEVQVMVCTSAFGMGIDQPDVDKVIRIGVPPSLEQCVQEFGRAGRDGRQCEGIIFFHESDLQHAKFWCEGEDADRQLQILTDFQASWRFVYSHLARRCQRRQILEHFQDSDTNHLYLVNFFMKFGSILHFVAQHLDDYSEMGHPYVRDYMLTSELTWVLCMSPLMSKLLSEADFMEADITYKASVEFEYLFNAVVFNYTTLRWHVVARVRLNRLTADAYTQCFRSVFETVKKDHPHFAVGKSLQGIILDWSDHQMKGLEAAVGEEVASKVAKGCRVHFARSVKRVSEQVNKSQPLAYRAFTTIAYAVPHQSNQEDVHTLFDVLEGKADIEAALPLCEKQHNVLLEYAKSHSPTAWKSCTHWVKWWRRDRHLRMLSSCFSTNGAFDEIPSDTNAVESHNRISKGTNPDILKVALMTTYKVDMVAALEHLAQSNNIPTSYEDLTPEARSRHATTANKARSRKRARIDDGDGPPDKRSHFQSRHETPKGKGAGSKSSARVHTDKENIKPVLVSPSSKDSFWKSHLGLHQDDRSILASGRWLNTALIGAAQTLLKRKFNSIGGLQDTLLKPWVTTPLKSDQSFVQLLHTGNNHWVTVTNLGCPSDTVKIFDSLSTGGPTKELKNEIARMLKTQSDYINLEHMDVAQQENGSDCGVYAIANALEICQGHDPSACNWEGAQMRTHLLQCLDKDDLVPFPRKASPHPGRVLKTSKVPALHCQCRKPYKRSQLMAQCSSCSYWFYKKCLNIPNIVFKKQAMNSWKCKQCS